MPRAPEEPSADERTRHEVTHLPCQPWCAWCVMDNGRSKPHVQQVPEFETSVIFPKTPSVGTTLTTKRLCNPCAGGRGSAESDGCSTVNKV